ncbi:MAG: hypothetical protein R3B38_02785 [Patescibacteria group bacterium]
MLNDMDNISLKLPDNQGEERDYEFSVLAIERLMEQHHIDLQGVFSGTYAGYPRINSEALLIGIKAQMATARALRKHASRMDGGEIIRLKNMGGD